jgi:flagellar basal-body rod modification protein FlgD
MSMSLMQMLQGATPAASRANAAASSSTAGSSSSSSSSSTTSGTDLTSTFLELLTVQLKNQSPLDPLDPNAFITELAQFDSLGELTQIAESMQTLVNDVS